MNDSLPAGTVIAGRYELHELLGAGGVGRVYAAVDQRLDRQVAIKLVPVDQARTADPASTARFVEEARTGARFVHPNAVTVFDAGATSEHLYLVTELVAGTNLAQHLETHGALPVDEAVRITDDVLGALAAAHAAGIVHRDIKPSNVLVDTDGNAKLADFGIAKRLDDVETSLTADGHFVGTPRYAAPEQAAGQPATAATDVYAVGVVLYEMLAGRPPYEGDTPVAVAVAHQTAPVPDVRRLRPETPPAVAAVVTRALAKAPAARFPQAAAMRQGLRGAPRSAVAAGGTRAYPIGAADTTAVQPHAGPSAAERLTQMSIDEDPAGSEPADRRTVWIWAGLGALLVCALTVAAFADGDGDGDSGAPRGSLESRPATSAAASTAPTTVATTTTASPTTTEPPTTTSPPATTTLPPTTPPPTAPPSPPSDLSSLLSFIAGGTGMGEKQADLLTELQKLPSLSGHKQREEAYVVARKAYDWSKEGALDKTLATYTIEILNEISRPGNGRGGDGDGDGDGGDGGDD